MISCPATVSSSSKALLAIASLNFEITSCKLPILQEYSKAYQQFHASIIKTAAKSFSVKLLMKEEMPRFDTLTKAFDTSETWSMYIDSGNRYIVFKPIEYSEPEWVTRISEDLQGIVVYCGDALVRQSKKEQQVVVNPLRYPLDQILLINLLIGKGLLVHAAGMIIDGKGYLFAGPSGAGKSTICDLFQDIDDLTRLSDDRIVVEKIGHEFLMFGTPWPGDAGIAVNESARLHGIFFLKQSEENSIKKLNGADTLNYFFKVASLPLYDDADMKKSLDFCEDLLKEIDVYELNFKPGPEIVKEVMSFVKG